METISAKIIEKYSVIITCIDNAIRIHSMIDGTIL